MRKFWSLFVITGALAGAFAFAGSALADDKKEEAKEPPEIINFDKAKNGNVAFPHKVHAEKAGKCDVCHGGETPLFPKEKTELKMKDMYEGKSCGHCHDGKKKVEDKVIFAAKGACTKCHKKDKK